MNISNKISFIIVPYNFGGPFSFSFLSPEEARKRSAALEHAELDQAAGEHPQRSDQTDGHEDTQQDVVQHHGHELPLLSRLRNTTSKSLVEV